MLKALLLAFGILQSSAPKDSVRTELVGAFQMYIKLSEACADSAHSDSSTQALAEKELQDFHSKVYIRKLLKAKEAIKKTADAELVSLFLDTIIRSRVANKHYETVVLGELFMAQPGLLVQQYLNLSLEQQKIVFPLLDRGFVDVSYRNRNISADYDSLKGVLVQLRPDRKRRQE